MTLAGDPVSNHLRVVRVQMDALGISLTDALAQVPEELRDAVRIRFEEETALPVRPVHVLSEQGGPRAWFQEWDPSTGYYWRRQREYLIDVLGWPSPVVDSLDSATDTILSHLEDPRLQGPGQFNVRGLVMGYVQSGKTSNFCALVAKAADAGYKLVIVLSGIHNSLRQQTQRRVNRALGLDPNTGVPLPEFGRRWISLTTDDLGGDFRAGTVDANVLQGNEHVVVVVKKNKTVLRRLTQWMGNHAPQTLPVLIIDDEADQASINTGGNRLPNDDLSDLAPADTVDSQAVDELDPSVINGLVRQLLRSFGRVCYVAYTATPYANVLINHESIDREVWQDLYPKDFIVALPRPNHYCGPERLFGRETLPGEEQAVAGLNVLEFVPDHEADLLTPRGAEIPTFVPQIPSSLETAFIDFVLGIAARQQRTGTDLPATMLVHVHHRKPVQNALGEEIRGHVATLRQAWRYDKQATRPRFVERWDHGFRPVVASVNVARDVSFDQIEPLIDRLFREPLEVVILNSDSQDVLDYEDVPNRKCVIIGGNRLSRGLTLEGLTVSYFVRRSLYFDTLLQMGRWFGYREDYVDLTRIWTTTELAGWFHDLALAEEELRREVARYERERLTPLQFGPRIRCHPAMMITAPNKMGAARIVQQSYSSRLLQTTNFKLDDLNWLTENLRATADFISGLGRASYQPEVGASLPCWKHVPWQAVDAFLDRYQLDPRGSLHMWFIRRYIQLQVEHGELTEWCVSVRGRQTHDSRLGVEPSLTPGGSPTNCIGRTRLRNAPYSIGALITPATRTGAPGSGDEEVGLAQQQIETARQQARDSEQLQDLLRASRPPTEGLLLVYPISSRSRPPSDEGNRLPLFDDPARAGCTVIGISLVFPRSDSPAVVEYTLGSVGQLPDA